MTDRLHHTVEPASSGRAKCKGCGELIAKGILRFGERLPNPFSDGKLMTHWFHVDCAAMKRPEPFLETVSQDDFGIEGSELDALRTIAEKGMAHRRVPRIDGAERSPTSRARCRHCREAIEKDSWRIGLVFYQEGMFNPSGFMHLACSNDYFETTDILDRITRFSDELSGEDLNDIGAILGRM